MNNVVKMEPKTAEEKALMLAVEQAVTAGNLAMLNPQQKLFYYNQVCASVGLNPLTRPLDFIQLNGKLVLYVKKDGTDQLRKINSVSITKIDQVVQNDCAVVTAYARDKNGKEDSDIGAVSLIGLKGEAYANAIMKAVTKAKRRVTLSISGMGLLDESEVETIPGAKPENFDAQTKTEAKTAALKGKLANQAPGAVEHMPEPVLASDPSSQDGHYEAETPPPVPAAAKKPAKEPEVLPKAEKPARKLSAKPTPPPAAPKEPEQKYEPVAEDQLGDVQVPFGEWKGKRLDDLTDSEVLALNDHYKRSGAPSTPHFKQFKANFDAYALLCGLEPDGESAPAEAEEDPAAFMEADLSPEKIALARVEKASDEAELRQAWSDLLADAKDPNKINLKGKKKEDVDAFNAKAIGLRNKRKAELGIK